MTALTAAEKYADIIALPGPAPDDIFNRRHPHMPSAQRAKIFAPFAALAGFDQAVRNKEVLYEPRRDLDPAEKTVLNYYLLRLHHLTRNGKAVRENPTKVSVEYFQVCTDPWNDAYGRNGLYKTMTGVLRHVDPVNQELRIEDEVIPFDNIYKIKKVAA